MVAWSVEMVGSVDVAGYVCVDREVLWVSGADEGVYGTGRLGCFHSVEECLSLGFKNVRLRDGLTG